MDKQKICFIMCVNNELYQQECIHYLERLELPEGFQREIIAVKKAESMTSGYNQGMKQADAKYKVYLHQDVLIVYPYFIQEILHIFQNPQIGMIGMVGSLELEDSGIMWDGKRVGKLYSNSVYYAKNCVFGEVEGAYQQVQAADGLLLATQYDIPWREDLFQKWDYYDVSQCMEFRRRGYQIVVPHMDTPWCIHDDGILDMGHFYGEREIFLKEYMEKEKIR